MVGFSYLSIRNAFLSRSRTVLSVKYRLDYRQSLLAENLEERVFFCCSNTLAYRFSSKRDCSQSKYKRKVLQFRSMGRCESSFDMTACQALVQSQFNKKRFNLSMSLFASFVRVLTSCFYFSQHVRVIKK